MNDRFLNWGDHGKPKSGKIIGRWQPIESASSRYCKRQLVMKNNSGDWSQSESAKYFELLIVLIITWTNCGRWEQLFHWFKNTLAWKWDLSMVYLIGNRLHGQYSTIDQPHFQTVAVYSRVNFRKWCSRRCEDEIAEFLIQMEPKNCKNKQNIRGTQREYSSKPLKHSIVKRILVFKR